jgi:hypothetical protein
MSFSARVPGVTPVAAIDWQADLGNTVGLQPLIESAELTGSELVGGRQRTSWRVTERLHFWRLGYRIHFDSQVTRVAADRLVIQVRATAGTRLDVVVWAKVDPQDPSGVIVTEHLTATAPALTIRYVAAQARAAHTEAFRRLPSLLGA